MTPEMVFAEMKKRSDLLSIPQTFGARLLLPAQACPAIHWVPTDDYFDEFQATHSATQGIYQGKRFSEKSRFTRSCGIDIYFYVKGDTLDSYRELSELIRKVAIGLYRVCSGLANFAIQRGRMQDREDLSQGCIGYVMDVLTRTPIYELSNTQSSTGETVTIEVIHGDEST